MEIKPARYIQSGVGALLPSGGKATWTDSYNCRLDTEFSKKCETEKTDVKRFSEKHTLKAVLLNATYEDIMASTSYFSPFIEKTNHGLNKAENSISLVPGMTIDLGTGAVLSVKDSYVDVQFKNESLYSVENHRRASQTAAAISKFIRYANGQNGSFGFDDIQRNEVASVLEKMGVSTNRDFKVNGESFSKGSSGRGVIEKIGGVSQNRMVTDSIMKQISERYYSNSDWI